MSEGPTIAEQKPKRERKEIASFVPDSPKVDKAEFTVPVGAGTKLGEIENVKLKIEKLPSASDELEVLHRLCFGRNGQKTTRKRTLREFSGFGKEEDLEKKKAAVGKLESKLLKSLLTLCDMVTTGTKVENGEALLGFLKEPTASGKRSIADIAGEKRKRAAAKKERTEKKKAKAEKAKGKAAKGKGKQAKVVPELKRPMTAFLLYSQAKRDKVRAENPEASMGEVSKILGEKWKGISDERRANYVAKAKELKDEYDKKKAALEAKAGAAASKSTKAPSAKKQKVEKEEEEEEEDDEEEEDEEGDEEDDEEEADDGEDEDGDAEEAAEEEEAAEKPAEDKAEEEEEEE